MKWYGICKIIFIYIKKIEVLFRQILKEIKTSMRYFKEVSNQNECVLCQFVMKLATNYIAKNSTEVQDP